MEIKLDFLKEKGISIEDGIAYTGSREKYISALQRYYKGSEENKKTLSDLMSDGDTEGLRIRVHALKSNSKMIGAGDMAASFEELEKAAGNGDLQFIRAAVPDALLKYDELIALIKPVGEAEKIEVEGELTKEEAKDTIEKLLDALEEFDDEGSGKLVKRLKGYPFRITQREKVDKAAGFIDNFLYDEAAGLIREIEKEI